MSQANFVREIELPVVRMLPVEQQQDDNSESKGTTVDKPGTDPRAVELPSAKNSATMAGHLDKPARVCSHEEPPPSNRSRS